MSLGLSIRRVDRQPLGSPDHVKAELAAVFPGLKFVLVEALNTNFLTGLGFVSRFLLWLSGPRGPRWSGAFQAAEFAIELTFDAAPNVHRIDATLYGRGSRRADPYLMRLAERTGWQVKY
jgi:hypothetical protein